MLTILIPTHNEAKRIIPTLSSLAPALKRAGLDYSMLVVDDGGDDTAGLVERFAKSSEARVQVVHFYHRLGKGGALVEGLKLARGDVVIYDADAATPPGEISKLLEALKQNDLAIGSRYLPLARVEGITALRRLSSRAFNLLVRLLFGLPFSDTQCGFKALRASSLPRLLAQPFNSRGWEWDIELLWRAHKLGLKVVEVPVEWHHVTGGPLESGSMVKTAWGMLRGILRLRVGAKA